MKTILYLTAVILLTIWMIGFFIYSAGILIHLILVTALGAVFLLSTKEDRVV